MGSVKKEVRLISRRRASEAGNRLEANLLKPHHSTEAKRAEQAARDPQPGQLLPIPRNGSRQREALPLLQPHTRPQCVTVTDPSVPLSLSPRLAGVSSQAQQCWI